MGLDKMQILFLLTGASLECHGKRGTHRPGPRTTEVGIMETLFCFLSRPDILRITGRTEAALELAEEDLGWASSSSNGHCPFLRL